MTGSQIIALPSFDAQQRIDAVAPAGSTVKEIVDFALPGATPEIMPWVRVSVGEDIVPFDYWTRVKPKENAVVLIRIIPGNAGVLRATLSIAVAVAAMALGQFYAAPLALGALGITIPGTVVGAAISATTLLAGTFLVNALVPARKDQSSNSGIPDSPTYSVQGFRNSLNPDGVIPCVMGKTRFSPPYAALPFTSANGETWVTALFLVGYGPVAISDIRIGDTPIDRYSQIEYEVREGYNTDLPVTLYPTQVLEERLSIQLVNNGYLGIPDRRFTASDCTQVQLDVLFPGGLFHMVTVSDGHGGTTTGPVGQTVTFQISYRLEGTGPWTLVPGGWSISGQTTKAFTQSYTLALPSRGRYEIELVRGTADLDDFNQWDPYNQYSTISMWTAIRSFRPEYPLAFNKPLALIAVRVRASKQLNGTLDNLNCLASRICKDWNGAAWVDAETQNPASLYRYALQGPATAYPVTDDQLDLPALQSWHDFCATNSLKYNRVQDYEASVYDVMGDIAAAGRAAPQDSGTKWGVVIDQKKTQTIAHITPRNSWDFSGERPYVIFPHAFRVKFYDETNLYKPNERLIPWPGFVGTPSIIESLDIPGVTNPDQIWLEARKRQYELIYRRDVWNIMQDFEGSIARRGDLVRLSHDILVAAQKAARVKAVSGNLVTLDDFVTMEVGKTYALRIRKLATSPSDAADQSILRTIETHAGDTNTVVLTGAGTAPDVGDLVMFGESTLETLECVVRETEGAEDFCRRLTLIPHAPEIFDLLAAEVPPSWNGRAGSEVGGATGPNLDFSDTANSQYIATIGPI